MLMRDFEIILVDSFNLTRIDSYFLASYYATGGDVNVKRFIEECGQKVDQGANCQNIVLRIASAVLS